MTAKKETSRPVDLLLSVARSDQGTLGSQIEDQLRSAIRDGRLHPRAQLPSTRDLARQLGVSRRVVVDAYSQLAAEGYLHLRQGARPRVSVSAGASNSTPRTTEPTGEQHAGGGLGGPPRFDLRPSVPDVSGFPRAAWLRSLRQALTTITDAELGYGDVLGVPALRAALADYLGRVRGVATDPQRVVITSGYTQSLGLVCRALAEAGRGRIAHEDPCNPEDREVARGAGLESLTVAVDDAGIRVDELARSGAEAVVLTPAHQNPLGVVISAERRTALVAWLRERDAIAIEDDYDAEYRYDRAAIGALQGLEPDHVIYAGSVSKTLAPALRLGWLVIPERLIDAIREQKLLADRGSARIEQYAFADFLARGELDRHLRRMRAEYRARRDALIEALAAQLPEASVQGVAAGLHVTVRLTAADSEDAIRELAQQRRISVETLNEYSSTGHPPTLLLGYGQLPLPAIPAAVTALADTIRAARN